ncbi:MAG TPA: YceI family protein [Candidatus Acidoferrales bacterium]|jgi:polyisoprenoid-binding protein YceI|nr:YceI family protein [Candidatus Acidoferrales bacterium]
MRRLPWEYRLPADSTALQRFNVVPAESTLSFFIKSGAGTVYGKTQSLGGGVEAKWDAEGRLVTEPTPRMHVEFAVDSLTSGTRAKDQDFWGMIDCSRFPKITGDLLQIVSTAGGINIAIGRITVAGIPRSYQGSFLVKRSQGRIDIDGFMTINIKDFGLKETRFLSFGVNADVKVRMIVAARS